MKINKKELTEIVTKITKQLTFEENFKNTFGNGNPWDKFNDLILEQEKLYEGLIKTYPIEDTVKKLNKEYPNNRIEIYSNDKYLTKYISIEIDKEIDSNNLLNTMNTYGWFLSHPKPKFLNDELKKINDNYSVIFRFEAKYDTEVTNEIEPKRFLHLTQYSNLKNIIEKGLYPKTNSKVTYHPERIYLLPIETKVNSLMNLLKQFFILNLNVFGTDIKANIKKENNQKYVVIEINLGDTVSTEYNTPKPRIKFFRDPNAPGGFYTLENIHPKNIILTHIITLDSYGQLIDVEKPNKRLK